MLINLCGAFQQEIDWEVAQYARSEGAESYSLCGRSPDPLAGDLYIHGLSPQQLHALAAEILAKVPRPVSEAAPLLDEVLAEPAPF